MKKIFSILIFCFAFILIPGLFAGCGNSNQTPQTVIEAYTVLYQDKSLSGTGERKILLKTHTYDKNSFVALAPDKENYVFLGWELACSNNSGYITTDNTLTLANAGDETFQQYYAIYVKGDDIKRIGEKSIVCIGSKITEINGVARFTSTISTNNIIAKWKVTIDNNEPYLIDNNNTVNFSSINSKCFVEAVYYSGFVAVASNGNLPTTISSYSYSDANITCKKYCCSGSSVVTRDTESYFETISYDGTYNYRGDSCTIEYNLSTTKQLGIYLEYVDLGGTTRYKLIYQKNVNEIPSYAQTFTYYVPYKYLSNVTLQQLIFTLD